MAQPLDRRNTTALGRWWWTVDRPALLALMMIICIGFFLIIAGSPPVARRLGYPDFYFVSRHQAFLVISTLLMIGVSFLDSEQVRRAAILGFLASFVLLALLPAIGFENKGSVRWLRLGGMSIQPSEFIKPCLAILLAWVFTLRQQIREFPSYRVASIIFITVAALLIIQPDFGMTLTISAMFGVQFFMAGMSFALVAVMLVLGVGGVIGAYHLFAHVSARIDRFLDPQSGDNFQVEKSLSAFKQGGLLGRGPGEGIVKQHIPDAHTDFIYSVAGEEFGLVFCLMIMILFAFVVVRGFLQLAREPDSFRQIAAAGLLTQFGVQALVNMGVAVNLLPAKGMTLPFLSYGGSSLLAMAAGMGMLLALTRKRYGVGDHAARVGNRRYGT